MGAATPARPIAGGLHKGGILLAPQVPINFQPFVSNPRAEGQPPYDRLMLVSSRVHNPMKASGIVF